MSTDVDLSGPYVPSTMGWVRDQVETYERTGGREANTLRDSGIPVIIVTMRGRSSGAVRKIALMRVEHGGEYALVASMGGAPTNPGWYHNLVADPVNVMIQDGPEPFAVSVREVTGNERAAWWERAVEVFPTYAEYEAKTDRVIPVLVASPRTGAASTSVASSSVASTSVASTSVASDAVASGGATDDPDSVSVRIEATPEACYEIVADVTQMGRLSPECTGGRWIGRTKEPVVGARFVGFNRRGWVRWATMNRVVTAEPGREFAFETGGSATRWRYRFEPDGDATIVTETREAVKDRPLPARVFSKFLLGGVDEHDDEMREGMRATLARLKEIAESSA